MQQLQHVIQTKIVAHKKHVRRALMDMLYFKSNAFNVLIMIKKHVLHARMNLLINAPNAQQVTT